MKEPQTIKAKSLGKYVVLSNGEVWNMRYRSNKPNIKKVYQAKDKYGYLVCRINNKRAVKTHRIIAKCFLPNPNNLPQVNHINEIKTDNRVENLEWCTAKYNCNYGTRNKRRVKTQTNCVKTSKPVLQYTLNGVFVAEYPSLHEVERQLGYKMTAISACCRGERKTAYQHKWFLKSNI